MIITISGTAGSGKSTLAKRLAKILGLKHYSLGEFRRQKAEELGMDINEYNKLGESESSTDVDADRWQENLGKNEDDFIIDGRLSFHFIPDSIKIFLDADENIRAERIFFDKRQDEQFRDVDDAIKGIRKRQESDEKRYRKYYGLNPFEYSNYDIVIDTTDMDIEEMTEEALKEIESVKGRK